MATRVATLLRFLLGRFLPDFKAAPKGGFLLFSPTLTHKGPALGRASRAVPERDETALMLGALAGQGGGRCPQLCLSICAVALSALSCQARPATKPPSGLG